MVEVHGLLVGSYKHVRARISLLLPADESAPAECVQLVISQAVDLTALRSGLTGPVHHPVVRRARVKGALGVETKRRFASTIFS